MPESGAPSREAPDLGTICSIDEYYSADYDSCVGLGENGDCYTQPFGFETTPSAHRDR